MKSRTMMAVLFFAVLLVGIPSSAKEKPGTKSKLSKTAIGQANVLMNGNLQTSWTRPDGFFDYLTAQSWNGEYPRLSGVGDIFQEGIVFGGFVTDGLYSNSLRVIGNTYFLGMQPGALDANGNSNPADVTSASARAFQVRGDLPLSMQNDPASWPDLSSDAASYFQIPQSSVSDGQKTQIASTYFTDWKEWPAAKGAPWYVDTVKKVRYDAAYDYTNKHHIPGIPGATKTIWYVANDEGPISQQSYGSPPIGMEMQMTLWSYASSTPLNNIIFKQVKLIYKGNPGSPASSQIDSMFISQWSDPDNGDAGDDFAGSDSVLNLNYDWNSKTVDAKYAAVGLASPAVGYVFLQGVSQFTGDPNDSAIVDFAMRRGYKYFLTRNGLPAPLSSALFFAAGTQINDPDNGTYNGTLQWYNLMRGDLPRPAYPLGTPFYQYFQYPKDHNLVTQYIQSGDPTTGQGWIDGQEISAGDRRLVTTHGPITMHKGDTAEVVIALLSGMGADNLGSVKVLKYNVSYAQFAFNNNFDLPSAPPSPKTSVSALDGKVVLNWGGDPNGVNTIESSDNKGFKFEGYNVYQLPSASASIDQGVRIATYDIVDNVTVIVAPALDQTTGVIVTKPVEFGSDKGISRSIELTQDYLKQAPLANGTVYYYAVTSYSYNPDWNNTSSPLQAPFPSLESAPAPITVTPASQKPGQRFVAPLGDSLTVTHTNSIGGAVSDGSVTAVVVQPDILTGDTYRVLFDTLGGWKVLDVTKGSTVRLSGTNQSGNSNYLTVDGVQVIVQGPQPGMKSWSVPAGARHFTPLSGWTGLGLEGFSNAGDPTAYDVNAGTIGWPLNYPFWTTSLSKPSQVHTVLLKLAAVTYTTLWDPKATPTDDNFSLAYRWLRRAGAAPADPSFAPWIINAPAGQTYPYQDFNYAVPFSAWDMDVNPPVRLAVGCFENNASGGMVDGRYWPPTYGTATADNSVAREQAIIFGIPYSTTPDPTLQTDIYGSSFPIMWMISADIRNKNNWLAGDEFQFTAAKVNGPNDVFSYVAPAPTYNPATAKADVDKINVFPNPYYGFNPNETNRLGKFVRFSHLPANATIRIFTLAGVLVRTLPTTDGTSTYADWNLRNESSLPVASGIYIAFIDMPGIGKTKTLKIAIVQEEQILPTY